jgi:perosamine synthetase
MAAFSFYGNKTITTGEGGMLCGDFGNAKSWRDGGFDEEYRNTVPGLNYRLSNLQAAVGLAQLERFDVLLGMRLANTERYAANLRGRGKWLFCAETDDPRGLQQHLRSHGVESRPIFTPLHLSPAFRQYAKGRYKVSEEIWMRHLALPTGPHVAPAEIIKITELVNEFFKLHKSKSGGQKRAA